MNILQEMTKLSQDPVLFWTLLGVIAVLLLFIYTQHNAYKQLVEKRDYLARLVRVKHYVIITADPNIKIHHYMNRELFQQALGFFKASPDIYKQVRILYYDAEDFTVDPKWLGEGASIEGE